MVETPLEIKTSKKTHQSLWMARRRFISKEKMQLDFQYWKCH